jgi:predicted lipoprotein
MRLALVLALIAAPAAADVRRAVETQILPGYAAFTAATAGLAAAAEADCTDIAAPYAAAFDAWMAVAHLNLGPAEDVRLSIAFWPDTRGVTPRALRALLDAPALPADYAEVSAAARGLFALDILTGDPAFAGYAKASPACGLVQAVARDLAAQAAGLEAGWRGGFADALLTAGADGNATFLGPDEALRALYTQALAGIEFLIEGRIERPLGRFDAPKPARAEAWRTGRPQRNILLSLQALEALALSLTDAPAPRTEAAFAAAREAAARLSDPALRDIADPQAWLKLDILRQRVEAVATAVEGEIGTALGVGQGFNAADGD